MRHYNIIFLEGVSRIGKSSQLVQLRQDTYQDRETVIMSLDSYHTPIELNDKINEIRTWCTEHPEGTLLINGSIAYSIVFKDIERHRYGSSYEEYEVPIKNFLNLLREFRIISLLMKSSDYGFLEKRTVKDQSFNITEVQMFYQGFEYFEQSQINSNFKWVDFTIYYHETILQILHKIKKILQ